MKNMMKTVLRSLLIGMVIGVVVIVPVAVIGAVRGGAEIALRWSRMAGMLIGAVGLVFAGMRWFSRDRDGGRYFRPGRTALELEAEVLNEQRQEKTLWPEGDGRKVISIWVAIGMVLAGLLPDILMLFR